MVCDITTRFCDITTGYVRVEYLTGTYSHLLFIDFLRSSTAGIPKVGKVAVLEAMTKGLRAQRGQEGGMRSNFETYIRYFGGADDKDKKVPKCF